MIDGKYHVISEIGRGGFGTVYQARHSSLNKLVAIKLLNKALLVDDITRARFEQEAKAGATLSHPNLVAVFDYGYTANDEPYLVMEFVEGRTLEDRLADGELASDDLLAILSQVAKALRYLHDSNIVHRDLKTANILVQSIGGDCYAKLLDLGIAKVFTPENGQSANLTSTGMIFGSPSFMSPEQCTGAQVDARSDIYSFGCVMYECLTGKLPFAGENSLQVILKHLHEPPPEVPYKTQREFELTQIIAKCLLKDPAERYQNAKELLDALQRVSHIQPFEKPRLRSDSRSRAYIEEARPVESEKAPPSMALASALGVLVLVACLVSIGVMSYGNIQKVFQHSSVPPAPVANQQAPSMPPQVQPSVVTAPQVNPAGPAAAPASADILAAERARSDRAVTEREAADQASARLQAERLELQKVTDQLAAQNAATEKLANDQAATRALAMQRAEALAKAVNARSSLVSEQLRALTNRRTHLSVATKLCATTITGCISKTDMVVSQPASAPESSLCVEEEFFPSCVIAAQMDY